MNVIDVIVYCLAIVSIVTLPFFIINWWKYTKAQSAPKFPLVKTARFPVKSVAFFVVPIVVVIVTVHIASSQLRGEVLQYLQGLSGDYTVLVDRRTINNPERVISALKEVEPQLGHHSHPTKRIRIDIQSPGGNLSLELARDSALPQHYWVFYPKYQISSENEIGRITTPVFDEY